MKNKSFILISMIIYLCTVYFVLHFGYLLDNMEFNIENIDDFFNLLNFNVMNNPFVFIESLFNKQKTFTVFILYSGAFFLFIFNENYKQKKFYRKGSEHGSARWGIAAELKRLKDNINSNNIIFSDKIKMSLNDRKTRRNNNIVVFGGSGTGKTRFFILPNILQEHSSFVITDPKGSIIKSSAFFLKNNDYKIKVLNLIDIGHSNNYNPFHYLTKDEEIFILVDNFIENTNSENSAKGDDFWTKSEKALFTCIFYYLYDKGAESEKNFIYISKYINEFANKDSEFTKKINELAKKEPFHISVINYKIVISATEKTLKSMIVSAGVRIAMLNLRPIQNLLHTDNLELNKIGDEKTALFIITPDTSSSFNFIVSMLYTQLMQKLVENADKQENERLKIPVRLLLDEFSNIGKIPNFESLVSTIRSRNISVSIILQNLAQLKNLYEKSWETILGNCDSLLFLGGKEQGLLKYLSEQFGKETVNTNNKSLAKSKQNTFTNSEGIISRPLITIDELETLENDKCIVSIRGFRPIIDKKFNIKKHKNYKYTGEFDSQNNFNVKEEFKTKKFNFDIFKNFKYKVTDLDIGKDDVLVGVNTDEYLEDYAEDVLTSLGQKI